MTTEPAEASGPDILAEHRKGVLLITLNRPQRLNALSEGMREGMRGFLREARGDAAVRAVVLTGAGRAFCSGADLVARPVGEPGGPPVVRAVPRIPRFAWLQDFHHVPVPVIAAVNGVAAGAGVGLALACDVRVMAADAYLYPAFVHRGLAADNGVAWTMARLAGPATTLRWLWNGERIPADVALQTRLADVVTEPGKALDEAMQLAQRWASGPTVAIGAIKQQVYRAIESSFADYLVFEELNVGRVSQTEDSREGVLAFRERREPRFQGR
jgi:2-(1,2-epoxy-1,2-dihydrophenyl)acetyl-CoA isomerase